MENKIYNNDVERIVNERNRAVSDFHERRQAKRQRKKLVDAVVYACFSCAFWSFGGAGWMIYLLAFCLSAICGLYSAFCFGRFFENGKCWGWK